MGRGRDRFYLPPVVPPFSVYLYVESVRDILIDSYHDVGLVRPKAEDWERAREGADRFFEWGGSWPLNVPSKPEHRKISERTCDRTVWVKLTFGSCVEDHGSGRVRPQTGGEYFGFTYLRSPYEWKAV